MMSRTLLRMTWKKSTNHPVYGLALLLVLLIFGLQTGCQSINRLREAQESFNQAAAAENSSRLDGSGPINLAAADTISGLAAAGSGYASALLSLEKLEQESDRAKLQQDGLWGCALTLKALCQWRLAQYSAALESSQKALATGNQLYPRDLALMKALPGLIKTDQAYAMIQQSGKFEEIRGLLTGPNGAVANLASARTAVDENHPIQIYLIQAQLAAYRNYTIASFHTPQKIVGPDDPARIAANAQLRQLAALLKQTRPDSSGQTVLNYWSKLCSLDLP